MNAVAPEPGRRLRGLLYACLTALLWGFLAIALKYSLRIAGIETIVCFRFLCAFTFLGAGLAAWRRTDLRILRRPPLLGLLGAVFLALNYRFYFEGVRLAGASGAQVLIQIAPVLLAVVGVLLFRETLARAQRLGLLGAVVGFALFYRDRVDLGAASAGGVSAIMVAAVTWVLWATLQKHLTLRGLAPQALNLLTYGVAGLLLLPFADAGQLRDVSFGGWLVLLFLGLNTLVAYGALGEALKDAPAHEVSMIIALNPLLTLGAMAALAALDVGWVAAEPIRSTGYVGAAVMVTGVVLVVGGRRRSPRGDHDPGIGED